MTLSESSTCPLCRPASEAVIWHNAQLRVIDAGDERYPGFTRVIWNDHVREMTDLAPEQRQALMSAVWLVELTQRTVLQPLKVNLAQFGNMVPHVHWHIIPRWENDPHFPDAIWATPVSRSADQAERWARLQQTILNRLPQYHAGLRQALSALPPG